jgi:hypothetical protein
LLAQYVENTSSDGPTSLAGTVAITPNPSSESIPTVASTATVTSDFLTGMKDLHILIVEGKHFYSPTSPADDQIISLTKLCSRGRSSKLVSLAMVRDRVLPQEIAHP